MFCLYFLFLQVQSKRLYLFKNLSISLGCPLYCHVISYDPLYFCGTSCNFSFVISNFTDLLLEYSLTSYRKIKSKYIRDLNVRQGSIKLLEENIGRILLDISQQYLFGSTSSVQFSRSVMSDSLRSHESQPARPPCLSPTPGVYSNSCPSSQ